MASSLMRCIMKKASFILIIPILFCLFHGCTTNKMKSWIFDYENDLTQNQRNMLDSLYIAHEKKTTNEIALVTTSNYGSDTNILFFAVNFGREHGVGKKSKNNGVVIAYSEANRKVMISTGLGTEKVLKDEIAKRIIDSIMIPHFKQGEIFNGLWKGSKAIVDFLERSENKIN